MKALRLVFFIALIFVISCTKPTILLEQDKSALTTTVYTVIRTGSLADDPKRIGEAEFLGELILRGTKTKTREQFNRAVEELGGSISTGISMDTIVVYATVITENLEPFLGLLTEAITEPGLSKEEFDKLKVESLAEISHIKNLNTRLGGLALRKRVFGGTSIELPTAGSLSTISALTPEHIVARHKRDFCQKNTTFAVATSVEEKKIKGMLETLWKKLPKGSATVLNYVKPQFPEKPEIIVVHKPGSATGSVLMGREGLTVDSPDRYTMSVANFSFGGEPLVSRLFRIVRGQLGYTYSVGSTYEAMGGMTKQQGMFIIYSTPAIEFTAQTIFKVFSMWSEYRNQGLDKDEILLAHESLINSYPFNFESAKKRLMQKVDEQLYGVPVLSPDEYRKKILSISNETITSTVQRLHASRGWVITIVADKDIITKQLADSQKDVPEADRLTVTKVISPDEVIQ